MPPSSEGDFPGGILLTRRGSCGSPEACRASRLPFFYSFFGNDGPIFLHRPTMEDFGEVALLFSHHHELWSSVGTRRMVGERGQVAFPGFTGLVSRVGEREGEVLSTRSASPSLDLKTRPQTCAPALPRGRRRLLQHHGGTWRCLSFPAGEVLSPACPPQIPQGS